jgi:hypothetical protein
MNGNHVIQALLIVFKATDHPEAEDITGTY